MAYLAPVPLITAALAWAIWRALQRTTPAAETQSFIAAMGLFGLCYLGLAISLFPYVVPHALTLWQAAATPKTQAFLLIATLFILPIIFMSYWVFRGKVKDNFGYH